MNNTTNIPAFPTIHNGSTLFGERGMTLRDWFAGMAMQGFLAGKKNVMTYADDDAKWAYLIADEMLKAREAK